MSYGILK
jgi:hypothetical protein